MTCTRQAKWTAWQGFCQWQGEKASKGAVPPTVLGATTWPQLVFEKGHPAYANTNQ